MSGEVFPKRRERKIDKRVQLSKRSEECNVQELWKRAGG
jgi:hypothetical protein